MLLVVHGDLECSLIIQHKSYLIEEPAGCSQICWDIGNGPLAFVDGKQLIELAAQLKLPAIYFERTVASDSGPMFYGPDFRRKGAQHLHDPSLTAEPADLPMQTTINFKMRRRWVFRWPHQFSLLPTR